MPLDLNSLQQWNKNRIEIIFKKSGGNFWWNFFWFQVETFDWNFRVEFWKMNKYEKRYENLVQKKQATLMLVTNIHKSSLTLSHQHYCSPTSIRKRFVMWWPPCPPWWHIQENFRFPRDHQSITIFSVKISWNWCSSLSYTFYTKIPYLPYFGDIDVDAVMKCLLLLTDYIYHL